ncbi:MAG: hypothetical protein WDW38_002146 [Sanguina aurantia]
MSQSVCAASKSQFTRSIQSGTGSTDSKPSTPEAPAKPPPIGSPDKEPSMATWKYGKTIQDPTLAPTLLAMFLLPAAALLILPFLPKF